MKLWIIINLVVVVIIGVIIASMLLTSDPESSTPINAGTSPSQPTSSCEAAGGTCLTPSASTPRCPPGQSADNTLRCPFTSEAKPICCLPS